MLKLSHREVVSDKVIARKGVDELEQGEATKVIWFQFNSLMDFMKLVSFGPH